MKLKVDIMIGINFDMDINFCKFYIIIMRW